MAGVANKNTTKQYCVDCMMPLILFKNTCLSTYVIKQKNAHRGTSLGQPPVFVFTVSKLKIVRMMEYPLTQIIARPPCPMMLTVPTNSVLNAIT